LKVGDVPLYMHIAREVSEKWNGYGNCGLVVGATYPEEMRAIRGIADDLPFLIPGIGIQGGDLQKTVAAGKDSRGRGMIISASRSITYASSGEDFAAAAQAKARELHDAILKAL
jgi:orotidine-5'-phosphate decarboxylase